MVTHDLQPAGLPAAAHARRLPAAATATAVALAAITVAAAGLPLQALAQDRSAAPALAAPGARITDEAIQGDYNVYARQQRAIKALNDSGRHRIASYSLAKAQCWLDVSFHEYTRNDRSVFPQEALEQSSRITGFLAAGGVPTAPDNPAAQTPLVNGAAKLRPDLWELSDSIKRQAGFACVQQQLACAEVELVHAGNEINQQQWRHAKPYVQIAEDLLAEAAIGAQTCPQAQAQAPAVTPVIVPAPVSAPAPSDIVRRVVVPMPEPAKAPASVAQPTVLSAFLLFEFDKRDLPGVRAPTLGNLQSVLDEVATSDYAGLQIAKIVVTGHADISNNTGERAYNVKLAEDRAKTARDYLVRAKGVDPRRIEVRAEGDSKVFARCEPGGQSLQDYRECLLPNRRVSVDVHLEAERR